jgi:fibronectin-binding autotransporter adhesin
MLMKFKYSKACAFLTMAVALAAVSPRAFCTTLTVTSLADSGAGTLRDRIGAAVPGDTIQIGLSGTITLNSELVLSKSLRINGLTASSLRISGNNHSRVFNITSGTAQIFNLTISDGRVVGTNGLAGLNGETVSGGGILVANGATLDLENCILTNNVALGGQGGPASSGLAGGGGEGYGGAIATFGSLTMVRCTLAGNAALGGPGGPAPSPGFGGDGRGGGLYLEGSANVSYSTLAANNAMAGQGGAGAGTGLGGGIFSWNLATLNVNTCTIVSNTASGSTIDAGGGIINVGTLTIRDSTIAYNQADYGGGLAGPADLGNTILAGNSASSLAAGPDANGSLLSSDYNLIQKTNGITFSGVTAHNIMGQSPLLGPLQYNGGTNIGYQLPTMAPLAGSPAIDNGKTSSSTDERGFNRPYDTDIYNADGGNGGDIGAFEVYPNNLYVTNNNDSGAGSLRQAILDNDGLGGGNSIYFSSNVVGTITLTSGSLIMNMSGQIIGPGAKVLAVSGNHNGRVFDIRNGPTAISGLTIRDGLVVGMDGGVYGYPGFDERGGGILSQYSLLLSNCVVCSNSVIGGVGGSANVGTGGNGGKASGGGLYSSGINLTLAYCLFDGNTCTGGKGGSAVNNFGGFGGNAVGGAVSTFLAPTKIIGCEFRNGFAKGGDGGSGNPSGPGGQGYGGGIYADSESTLAVSDSTIAGNTAAGGGGSGPGSASGGGAYSTVTWGFTNCTIANNTATGSFSSGGGLWSQGSLMVYNCTITGNQAEYGGGIAGNPTLGNTIVAGNTAANAANGPDGSGTFFSENYNLVQNTNGMALSGALSHTLIGLDPLLGPLTNNGGPTRTCALRAGSPAIDKGKNCGPATDQRGAPRPYDFPSITNAAGGDGSDIGAFELGRPSLTIQQFANTAVLSWPSYYSDFTLQSVTDINASNSWANVGGTPVVVASQYVLTNGPISGNRFYRLKGN